VSSQERIEGDMGADVEDNARTGREVKPQRGISVSYPAHPRQ